MVTSFEPCSETIRYRHVVELNDSCVFWRTTRIFHQSYLVQYTPRFIDVINIIIIIIICDYTLVDTKRHATIVCI